ncbi:MAG: hypothetical protein OXU20_30245 [Myxococcales bacterium]|nr:hypothetical protein [Myxococcales bacterium]
MMHRTRVKFAQLNWVLPNLVVALLLGCAASSRPSADSESHWLRQCTADSQCGRLECLCGVCSVSCDSDRECNGSGGDRASCNTPAERDVDCPDVHHDEAVCLPACTGPACANGTARRERERERPEAGDPYGRPALCARDRDDAIRAVFCAPTPPTIGGLTELQQALGLQQVINFGPDTPGWKPVAVLGHSTAPSGHRVSPINPRLIMMGGGKGTVFMAYQRGVQKVELIAREEPAGRVALNFYLLRFEQACNRRSEGCSTGELYTPQAETEWLSWTLEDDEDLKNTADDCRQCHQRGRETPALLMREITNPWTHFLLPEVPTDMSLPVSSGPGVRGADLLRDYLAAKGSEPYGGFDVATLDSFGTYLLSSFAGFEQPLLFDGPAIERERWPYDPETGYSSEPKPSPTWDEAYEAFKRGEQLALPYLAPRAVDVDKQARLGEAYTRYRAGEIGIDALPDLADIFPDDPMTRARIGLQTEPGADAVEVMIQACGSCHNDVLDQSISRAHFNINLWSGDPEAVATAVERVELAPDAPGAMPPPEARQLDEQGRQRLLEYLRSDPLAREPDGRLVRAAELGMAGGGAAPDGSEPLRTTY